MNDIKNKWMIEIVTDSDKCIYKCGEKPTICVSSDKKYPFPICNRENCPLLVGGKK